MNDFGFFDLGREDFSIGEELIRRCKIGGGAEIKLKVGDRRNWSDLLGSD